MIVLQHPGGAKGKAVLEAARKADALEIGCAKLARPEERIDFVRAEVRRAGGTIAAEAAATLVDAVGSDLRELAAVSAQLVSDSGGQVDVDLVRAYHRGRAEVTGFAVSDLAVNGKAGSALETLRFALSVGVPHVVIADAIADGVRSVAKVIGSGRADPFALAGQLGIAAVEGEAGHRAGSRLDRAGASARSGRRRGAQCRRQGRGRRSVLCARACSAPGCPGAILALRRSLHTDQVRIGRTTARAGFVLAVLAARSCVDEGAGSDLVGAQRHG